MIAQKNFPARALLIAGVSVVLLTSIVAQQAVIGFGRAAQVAVDQHHAPLLERGRGQGDDP